MLTIFRPFFFIMILFSVLMASATVLANKMPWQGKDNYSLLSKDESLVDVLKNFANTYNAPVFVSQKITGNVNGHFPDKKPQEFLQDLSDVHNLNWYFDGAVLYFYKNDEIENKLIQLNNIKPRTLRNNLHSLGIWDHQYNWREIQESGIIYLSGPPRMVEIIVETAEIMDKRAQQKMESTYSVRFFPLKYATAYDQSVSFRQQQMTVPGVVTMLKKLVESEGNNKEPSITTPSAGVNKLKGKGINSKNNNAANNVTKQPISNAGDKVTIEADVRSNAVVVYDLISRMPIYEQLIEKLDKPVDQIEISVSIINVRTNKVEDLGISWQASIPNTGVVGFGDLPNNAEPDGSGIGLALGSNVSFTSVLGSGTNHILSRINMLAEEGQAQVISRPSVISTDNMEAILDNSSTFYVRVAGRDEVDLFPISVGSVLKVTPHVINADEQKSIHLEINIEDGQQTQERVDNIPTIQNSSISTRAVVGENESLLIGGYHFDTMVKSESHVPFLSSIPLIGSLFRRTHEEKTRMARLFLISPRIVRSKKSSDDLLDSTLSITKPLDNFKHASIDQINNPDCDELLNIKRTVEPAVIIPDYCQHQDHNDQEEGHDH